MTSCSSAFPSRCTACPTRWKQFVKLIPPRKKIAFFCTHGSLPGHRLSREAIEYAVVLATQAKVLGTFCTSGAGCPCRRSTPSENPRSIRSGPRWALRPARIPTPPTLKRPGIFARQMKLLAVHAGH